MERKRVSERESATEEPMSKKAKIVSDKVRLSIGEIGILADKQRLIATSTYFASLFKFHADSNLDVVSLVPPENVDMDSFLAVLNSLSNIKLKLDISASNLWDFIVVAQYLQLDQTEKECLTALRTMSLQMGMDDLCQMWRKGKACAFERVTTLVVAAISLRMGSVRQSSGFLDFHPEELVALLSDDAFLPFEEKDVCKAVNVWCEHDPENRKKLDVLSPILAEVVWDDSASNLLASLDPQCKPEKPPKRATNIEAHDIPRWKGSDENSISNGVVVGNYLYCLDVSQSNGSRYEERFSVNFSRINLSTKDRTALTSIGLEDEEGVESESPAEYCLCAVKLSGHDKIGCFISYWNSCGGNSDRIPHKYTYLKPYNTMGLYDTDTGTWEILPSLPYPRDDSAMIQCDSFLYVIGGIEYKPSMTGEGNANHCYRLDLTKLTDGRCVSKWRRAWERVADLNIPRTGHCARIQHGRIIVYGGQTESGTNYEGASCFEKARLSEAYDTTLNIWTTFE